MNVNETNADAVKNLREAFQDPPAWPKTKGVTIDPEPADAPRNRQERRAAAARARRRP